MAQVVKLAQPGYDVKTTGDENLIYSSQWPLLPIVKQGTFTTNDFSTLNQTIFSHNLGFRPMFWVFANSEESEWSALSTNHTPKTRSEFMGRLPGIARVYSNEQELFFHLTAPITDTGTVKFEYIIFAINLDDVYDAPKIRVGGITKGGSGGRVFKIAKPGKDIDSSALEDYVIHSDARSPLIQTIKGGPLTPDATLTFPATLSVIAQHDLGYKPMFFVYNSAAVPGKTGEAYIQVFTNSTTPFFGMYSDEHIVKYYDFVPTTSSLVVLKDPFNADYNVDVSV